MVGNASCLAATVHGENGIAHIHTSQWKGRGKDVSKGAASSHIAVVDETLAWNACLAAYLCEHSRRNGITCIFL